LVQEDWLLLFLQMMLKRSEHLEDMIVYKGINEVKVLRKEGQHFRGARMTIHRKKGKSIKDFEQRRKYLKPLIVEDFLHGKF
jgi:hypothetical protein